MTRNDWWKVGLLALLPLLGWWTYGLLDLDEGFYAAITAEMNRTGSWITPLYNGHPWYEKPILLYWIAKPCIAIFGDPIGPRLPSILATLATCGLVGWWGNRRISPLAGALAVLVFSTSLLVIGAGRMMLVDPLLVLCLTGCFLFFWESLVVNIRYRPLAAGFLAASVLAKGPVGCVFFLTVIAYTYFKEPDMRPRFRGGWTISILVFLAVVSSWYLPAYLKDGNVFVQKFLVEQNLQRFSGGDEAHLVSNYAVSLIYFIPVLLLGMVPWAVMLPKAWVTLRKDHPEARYLFAWALSVFLLFTISRTKLPHYILPCFPPLAMIVGAYLARCEPLLSRPRYARWLVGSVGLSVLANAVFYGYWASFHKEIQGIAKAVARRVPANDPNQAVAIYQMSRQVDGRPGNSDSPLIFGLIRVGLNETSHPSLLLYLDRHVLETDRFADLLANPARITILTRAGRIGLTERAEALSRHRSLEAVQFGPKPPRYYQAFVLESPVGG